MALVSMNNFTTPLTNRVHLGTIFVVVLLFAAFRIAGGDISTTSSKSGISNSPSQSTRTNAQTRPLDELPSSMDQISPAQELSKLGMAPARPVARVTGRPVQNDDSNLLDGMMGSDKRKDGNQNTSQGDLDDVERRLGLR